MIAGQLGRDGNVGARPEDGGVSGSASAPTGAPARARRASVRQAQRNLQWVRPDALVFTTMRGKPQSRRNVLRAVYTAGDNIGLNGEGVEPVGLHDLRHSFVAVAFEQGLSAQEVAKLVRHANPKVTLGMYAGLTDEGREKAIAKLAEGGFGR